MVKLNITISVAKSLKVPTLIRLNWIHEGPTTGTKSYFIRCLIVRYGN
jgi:hypothetical protein